MGRTKGSKNKKNSSADSAAERTSEDAAEAGVASAAPTGEIAAADAPSSTAAPVEKKRKSSRRKMPAVTLKDGDFSVSVSQQMLTVPQEGGDDRVTFLLEAPEYGVSVEGTDSVQVRKDCLAQILAQRSVVWTPHLYVLVNNTTAQSAKDDPGSAFSASTSLEIFASNVSLTEIAGAQKHLANGVLAADWPRTGDLTDKPGESVGYLVEDTVENRTRVRDVLKGLAQFRATLDEIHSP